MRVLPLVAVVAGLCCAGACGGGSSHATAPRSTNGTTVARSTSTSTAAPTTVATTTTLAPTTTTAPATTTTAAPPPSTASTAAPAVASAGGRVVVIDPGHNGKVAEHPAEANRLVDIGNGTKPCQNTGTQTNDGYTEHAFNWDVALRVAARLRAAGITVILTRPDDNGWGPCSVDRAAIANRAHAAAAVSIHADGGPPDGRGFHVIEPALLPGLTDDIYARSKVLGTDVHDALVRDTVMPRSTYAGNDGYQIRSDLGGLDRADVPAIFVECGNMRNATDASLLESTSFRDQLAAALADGILHYVAVQ